jgi:hypothetical protein
MRRQHGARRGIRARIADIRTDVTHTQRRFAEANRPWIARRVND